MEAANSSEMEVNSFQITSHISQDAVFFIVTSPRTSISLTYLNKSPYDAQKTV